MKELRVGEQMACCTYVLLNCRPDAASLAFAKHVSINVQRTSAEGCGWVGGYRDSYRGRVHEEGDILLCRGSLAKFGACMRSAP